MISSIDIWKILAGVAIFLIGMTFLEDSLKHLAGRPFKLFLKKQTSNKLKALTGGAVVTAILQSSSLVNLMVLAFVGAGIIQMQNALAIMLGANFGTTFNSWIIATVGFHFNIENISLPIAGVAGILMVLVNRDSRLYYGCRLALGFGFLFIGLEYIKFGMESSFQQVHFQLLAEQPTIIFLLLGFFITAIIQSSSATIALTLSALHAEAISLVSATAIVLGSETGTTIKLILASLKGSVVKRRVAAGNVLFNIIGSVVVFVLLLPINKLITNIVGIEDNLMALVFFQSLVNLMAILLFYPFLGIFSKYLEKRFVGKDEGSQFIGKITDFEMGIDLALDAIEKETRHFIFQVLHFTANAFQAGSALKKVSGYKHLEAGHIKEEYEFIKGLHGEIHKFSIQLQNIPSAESEKARLGQLISCIRNGMYGAKNIRDILHDIEQLRNSSNDAKYDFYKKNEIKIKKFCRQIAGLLEKESRTGTFESIVDIYQNIQQEYTHSLQELYKEGVAKHLRENEISTLINFNREMHTAFNSFIFVVKDFLLDAEEARYFEELPGFIR